MHKIYKLNFFLSILFVLSCTGSKKLTRKAAALEKVDLYEEAAAYYLQALESKSTNIDAKIGLKKNGQKVLDYHLGEVFKAFHNDNYKAVVSHYLIASDYNKKVHQKGVFLTMPDYYKEYFEEAKEKHLSERYQMGLSFIEEKKYENALNIFKEILKVDETYKDALHWSKIAYTAPLYEKAISLLEQKNYWKSYAYLIEVQETLPNYEDVNDFIKALEKEITLNILSKPFINHQSSYPVEDILRNRLHNQLQNKKGYLIKILDASVHEEPETELKGEIISVYKRESQANVSWVNAYQGVTVKQWNKEEKKYQSILQFKKIKFPVYQQHKSIDITVNYELIDLKKGTIVLSNSITRSKTDRIQYGSYNGNTNLLYPDNSGVGNSSLRAKKFRQIFTARKELVPDKKMIDDISDEISVQIAKEIFSYQDQLKMK